jgi:hypothetical protein
VTLHDVLEDAAAGVDAAKRTVEGAVTVWSVGGRPFAATDGTAADFRLKPVVARAALGTPDTVPSGRGSDWMAFRPPALDRFAVDRAKAWFVSAAALAGSEASDSPRPAARPCRRPTLPPRP